MLAAVDWSVVWERLFHPDHVFFRALLTTVYIAIAAQILGVLLGLVAALMRMSHIAPMRWLSGFYVLIFRGTPLLVQIFFVYYGINLLFGFALIPTTLNVGLFAVVGAFVGRILALGT